MLVSKWRQEFGCLWAEREGRLGEEMDQKGKGRLHSALPWGLGEREECRWSRKAVGKLGEPKDPGHSVVHTSPHSKARAWEERAGRVPHLQATLQSKGFAGAKQRNAN